MMGRLLKGTDKYSNEIFGIFSIQKEIFSRLLCDAALFNNSVCNTYVSYLLKSLRATCNKDLIELIVHGYSEFKKKSRFTNNA